MIEAGNANYEKSVSDGIAEQQRLVSEAEVVIAAKSEADRIVDSAYAESDRLRGGWGAAAAAPLGPLPLPTEPVPAQAAAAAVPQAPTPR